MMDSPEYLVSEGEAVFSPCVERSWRFAVWFTVIAFIVGGAIVFWMGYCTRMPVPPPGTAACGRRRWWGRSAALLSDGGGGAR